jgi:hypothetical protein
MSNRGVEACFRCWWGGGGKEAGWESGKRDELRTTSEGGSSWRSRGLLPRSRVHITGRPRGGGMGDNAPVRHGEAPPSTLRAADAAAVRPPRRRRLVPERRPALRRECEAPRRWTPSPSGPGPRRCPRTDCWRGSQSSPPQAWPRASPRQEGRRGS